MPSFQRIVFLFLVCFFCSKHTGYAQTTPADTSYCLVLTGNFDGTVKDLEGTYKAQLILNNKVIQEQNIKVKKSFE